MLLIRRGVHKWNVICKFFSQLEIRKYCEQECVDEIFDVTPGNMPSLKIYD